MYGIIGYNSRYSLRPIEDIDVGDISGGGGSGGGGGIITSVIPGSNIAAPPTFNYDLSQIGQAIARGNKQSDIESAYQTFLTGIATGRGGQYAADAQRKYGYASIRDAAAGYLDAAGLPRLASVVGGGNGDTGNGGGGNGGGGNNTTDNTAIDALRKQLEDAQKTFTDSQKTLTDSFNKQLDDLKKLFEDTRTDDGSPLEQLVDVLPGLFGQSVYNPPLQSQTYGYTPQSVTDLGGGGATSGGFGMILILVVVAIVGYLLYKKFAS